MTTKTKQGAKRELTPAEERQRIRLQKALDTAAKTEEKLRAHVELLQGSIDACQIIAAQLTKLDEARKAGVSDVVGILQDGTKSFLAVIDALALPSSEEVRPAKPAPAAPAPKPAIPPAKAVSEKTKADKKGPDLSPYARGVVKASFCREGEPPATLEAALEAAYGEDWRNRRVNQMKGGGKVTTVPLGEDVAANPSIIKTQLTRALELLLLAESHPRKVAPKVRQLQQEIAKCHTIAEVAKVMSGWLTKPPAQSEVPITG